MDLEQYDSLLQLPKSLFPMDAMVSCLTMEVVARNQECWEQLLKNISGYLRQGGLFILLCSINVTCYFVEGLKYLASKLSVNSYVQSATFQRMKFQHTRRQ